jgi:peptidoglycan-associated lipoprotein
MNRSSFSSLDSLRLLAGVSMLAAAALAGCASGTRLEPPAPVEDRTGSAQGGNNGANGAGRTSESTVSGVDLTSGANKGSGNGMDAGGDGRTVYFDYDSYSIKDEYRSVIETNARKLSGDRKRRLQAEGHTDERGGSEYNLALGQRRAEAVVKALVLVGAQDNQLEAVSFGKERPAVQGSDESAWARNRRVELKDR